MVSGDAEAPVSGMKAEQAEDVFSIAENLFDILGSHNIFTPKVLAKVSHNGKMFVGSSISVSHCLRPLCLHERVIKFKPALKKAIVFEDALPSPSDDQATESSWSSAAYGHESVQEPGAIKESIRYNKRKDPCKKCRKTFKELVGFLSVTNLTSESDESFLGACAEYCPVDVLLIPDDVKKDTDVDMRLERHREQCSSFFADVGDLCKYANDLDVKGKDEKRQLLKDAAISKVDALNIFGFRRDAQM